MACAPGRLGPGSPSRSPGWICSHVDCHLDDTLDDRCDSTLGPFPSRSNQAATDTAVRAGWRCQPRPPAGRWSIRSLLWSALVLQRHLIGGRSPWTQELRDIGGSETEQSLFAADPDFMGPPLITVAVLLRATPHCRTAARRWLCAQRSARDVSPGCNAASAIVQTTLALATQAGRAGVSQNAVSTLY